MNIVTIHPPKARPLTFADIPPGRFKTNTGRELVKLSDQRRGEAIDIERGTYVTLPSDYAVFLPDSPPADDTVAYGDLVAGDLFEYKGFVYERGDLTPRNDNRVYSLDFRHGCLVVFSHDARVRRLNSVTITRDEGSQAK